MTREELIDKYNNLIIDNRTDIKAVATYKQVLADLKNMIKKDRIAEWAEPHECHVERFANEIYVKLYFEDNITVDEMNKYYLSSIDLFKDEGFALKGITEYFQNRELCFTFYELAKNS